ncbi:type II toxin-antitoxin system PemK/MazF family toxin [Methanolobus zinderi]|uniref:Type II toxin-antitoxin system PemK/MazF family toxin n=1 Tax=Methanolobus zinderi TaxID=536044 RepID=A0A7D5I7G0_9EURY|nr:type II toxin-antitoxin system PemK/MazF family toxin [Methanolobus zinderi]QLC49062.1 type II toxin-antitoxin system PemK/MazF family toxin [Methanolobus zinderi]
MPRKGDIVIINFPFTNGSSSKLRPALALTDQIRSDIVLCQITSKQSNDSFAICLTNTDLSSGAIRHTSWIRINKIFTMDSGDVRKVIGSIDSSKRSEVQDKLNDLFGR